MSYRTTFVPWKIYDPELGFSITAFCIKVQLFKVRS
jgi:hypothetical protein